MNILIIEDSKLLCNAYKTLLDSASNSIPPYKLQVINDCESAYYTILGSIKDNNTFDLVLLDIQLPSAPELKLYSGEDIGIEIRRLLPKTKIIVLTNLSDNFRLYNIFKNINPEGLIIKTDIDEKSFIDAINTVIADDIYYSKIFKKLIKNQFSENEILNKEERELLYLLSKGINSKDIPIYIPWSESKVEKKKKYLREVLGAENRSVLSLVSAAKTKGYI